MMTEAECQVKTLGQGACMGKAIYSVHPLASSAVPQSDASVYTTCVYNGKPKLMQVPSVQVGVLSVGLA